MRIDWALRINQYLSMNDDTLAAKKSDFFFYANDGMFRKLQLFQVIKRNTDF